MRTCSIADAEATDDYIDDVYGEDGDYDSWQSAISDAESAYETAASSAWSGLQKSLAAHDAALESALADTYADALEQFALDYPTPWSTRAAADARAKSDKIAADQSAQSAYADSVNDAQAVFDTALATADAARSESQADALRASLQAQSEAAVTKAENQATADTAAAGDEVRPVAEPESAEPKEAAEDVTAVFNTEEDETSGTFTAPELLEICFAAGTPVLMADGTMKPIETIQPGDQVLAAPEHEPEGPVSVKTVERVFHNPPSELVVLTIGKTLLRSTPAHLFYVREKGWMAAKDLEVGDELRSPDGRWVAVDTKGEQGEPEPVFNFGVADYHTYFVGSPDAREAVLVHNECALSFEAAEWNGYTYVAEIFPTGTYKGDLNEADKIVKKYLPADKFPGRQILAQAATWNHKSFNPKTGTFVMELVGAFDHASQNHVGGMAEYLDWVAKVVHSGEVKNLSNEQATAVLKTLKDGELGKRVNSRLKKLGVESGEAAARFLVKRLKNNGYRIVINSATGEVTEIVAKKVGARLVGGVLRVGVKNTAKALPAIVIAWSAGEALADTGSPTEAGKAAVRELVMADLVEGAFKITVVRGSEKLGEFWIRPEEHLRKKYSQLTERERAQLLANIEGMLENKTFMELEEYFKKREIKEDCVFTEIWEGIDGGWGKK